MPESMGSFNSAGSVAGAGAGAGAAAVASMLACVDMPGVVNAEAKAIETNRLRRKVEQINTLPTQ